MALAYMPHMSPVPTCLHGHHGLRFAWRGDPCDVPKAGQSLTVSVYIAKQLTCDSVKLTIEQVRCGAADVELFGQIVNSGDYDTLWQALLTHSRRHADMSNTSAPAFAPLPGRDSDSSAAQRERIGFLRATTGATLDLIAQTDIQPESLANNIEAFVGTIELPVGIVGPLWLNSSCGMDAVYVPFATTEGALVASATRGVNAISHSGGAYARALGQRVMRVPSFEFSQMAEAIFFADWIQAHIEAIREQVRRESAHATLISIDPELFGRRVHLHFVYRTADAAGQNMVTACTARACQWILAAIGSLKGLELRDFYIEAGLANDKRLSARSFVQSRGVRVSTEALLKADVIRKVLKLEPSRLMTSYHYWCACNQVAGNVGSSLNIANAIAAIFAATGQDLASVHEASVAALYMDRTSAGDVYVNLTMPGLLIGTVGGGTGLPQQRQCLELMGCAGRHKVARLAEIIATTAMALDISLLAALSAGHFASAHQRMGRNRPMETSVP
ncbi:hydroxymethylglutaryl-CoA reductase [Dyella jejuensis]|uniref:Hydroxymethylglutaryl-CoA reductase n=1 Tax=Dyella jejuensis TaxID=1432009 RepID=A0ABW8JFZ3_9GAMM